jgi:hypothetical protein
MHRPARTNPAHPLQGPDRIGHKHSRAKRSVHKCASNRPFCSTLMARWSTASISMFLPALGLAYSSQDRHEPGAYLPISCCARLRLKSIPSVLSGCSELMRGPISSIQCRSPLPGARKPLAWLTEIRIPWAIAASGRMETAAANLATLNVDPCKRCDNHARSGQARKAGSGSVPGRSRPSRCPRRKGDCGRGQYLRYARGNALPGVGDRTAQRRIQFR